MVQVLADKTVVLATNQLQFVSMADVVVVMRGGAAVEVGSYNELMAAGGVFAALMKEAQVRVCRHLCGVGGEEVQQCQVGGWDGLMAAGEGLQPSWRCAAIGPFTSAPAAAAAAGHVAAAAGLAAAAAAGLFSRVG
jgi:hypothetical protein